MLFLKNKKLCIVTVIITLISVCTILFYDDLTNIGQLSLWIKGNTLSKVRLPDSLNPESGHNNPEDKSGTVIEDKEQLTQKSKENTAASQKEEKKNDSSTGKKDDSSNEKSGLQASQNKNMNQVQTNTGKNTGSKQSAENVKQDTSVSVFKVSREKIVQEISVSDKLKLISIANKVSPIDYAKINNYLNEPDVNEGVKKAFALLKLRLSKKDYEKLKEATSEFIDIDLLEKEIAKGAY